MTSRTVQALLCADRAVVGAFLITIAASSAAMAVVPHTEQSKPVLRMVVASPPPPQMTVAEATPSPAELAAMRMFEERRCLAEAMYYEARGEGTEGELAIAEVVFHRTHVRAYPRSICGVVYEGSQHRNGCQFSFTCSGVLHQRRSPGAWAHANLLAARIMSGAVPLGDLTDDATSFHTVDTLPGWADTLERTVQIGNHIFYRELPRTRSS